MVICAHLYYMGAAIFTPECADWLLKRRALFKNVHHVISIANRDVYRGWSYSQLVLTIDFDWPGLQMAAYINHVNSITNRDVDCG